MIGNAFLCTHVWRQGVQCTTHYAFWWPTAALVALLDMLSSQAEVAYLPLLGYAKTVGISSYSKKQLCLRRLWANKISHVPQFLFGFFFKKKKESVQSI
jgi:hypothetical protein